MSSDLTKNSELDREVCSELFVTVANKKSISKAANSLKFSQSNVTSRIKQLEKNLETLEKGNLGLEEMMTQFKEGQKLAEECKKMLDAAEEEINKES